MLKNDRVIALTDSDTQRQKQTSASQTNWNHIINLRGTEEEQRAEKQPGMGKIKKVFKGLPLLLSLQPMWAGSKHRQTQTVCSDTHLVSVKTKCQTEKLLLTEIGLEMGLLFIMLSAHLSL